LVLFSKSEASKNMGAEALELRSKHAERRSAENSEKSQQNIYADDAFDADSNGRDKEEGQERSEPISSERKRRDRADLDEGAPEELPGLYMDAVKRKNRDPVQPYRPPIALLSKKAAAGQERSRVSSQVSVLDRLGTAPVQDSVSVSGATHFLPCFVNVIGAPHKTHNSCADHVLYCLFSNAGCRVIT
jgi:hypothetical protein